MDIFPSIIQKFPSVKLCIGGSICKSIKEIYVNCPNIEFLGYVDKEEDFYKKADVVINPTFQGTGLKIKTFEAIAYDKVCIAHPHSLIGIYKPEEAPILSSVRPNDWVENLHKVWNIPGFVENIKRRNKVYIQDMMTFVESEYLRFFQSLNK